MPNDNDRMQWRKASKPWKNWHETVKASIKGVYLVRYPKENPPYGVDTINRCTHQIQRAIAAAKKKGFALKTVGRGWSLSEVPTTNGAMLDVSRLNGMKPLRDDQIRDDYKGDAEMRAGLWLVQCGAFVSEINKKIEGSDYQRSLMTTGAANGQTITGATSTGTHGSVLTYGALHDSIVAIHLIATDKTQYWLERKSYPVAKPALINSLGATFKADDALFNAVVMGLGAFGVIHNVVLETQPRFLLDVKSFTEESPGKKLVLDAKMRSLIKTLNFDAHPVLKSADGRQPHFFQPIIDPNTNPPEVLASVMYKGPWKAGHRRDYRMAEAKFGPSYDFVSVMGALLDIFKKAVPLFSQIVKGALFNTEPRTGSWGEIFGYKPHRTKVASAAVAVAHGDALKTLDVLIQLNKDVGPAPVVFGCRYVKKSKALLAMNRFNTTFVISIDGVYNKTSLKFFDKIPEVMDKAGIKFTQHWGKTNGYTKPRVEALFGADLIAWRNARKTLLPDAADRKMFENKYMKDRGLTG